MIRVLHVFHNMGNGGIEQFVMNYYRHIDRNAVQFDFLTSVPYAGFFDQEILANGGRLYHACPYANNPIKTYMDIASIVNNQRYTIIHRHTGSAFGYFDLRAAKSGGADHLILHAHNTEAGHRLLHRLSKSFLSFDCIRFACSEESGRFLFGNDADFRIIRNAIDVSRFTFDEQIRNEMRKALHCDNKLVIGHVGRFAEQKNHQRLLSIFEKIHAVREDSLLLCIGDGALLKTMQKRAAERGITDSVLFLGQREDVHNLLQAMDVFLLPSLWEGFGISLLEAQASGLPCFASKEATPEAVNVTGNTHFLSLHESDEKWAAAILSHDFSRDLSAAGRIRAAGFDIVAEARKLQTIYENLA